MTPISRYVGGVTVALGVAATATALAQPASATPGRPGSSAQDSAHEARDSPSNPDRSPARERGASARVLAAGSAGAKTSGRTVMATAPRAAAATLLAPAVSRAPRVVGRADRRGVIAVPAPEAISAPGSLRFDSRGRLLTIYKGTSFVIPNQWALWVRKDSGSATFTADSAYDLKDEDQYDWNKLAGITYTPWRPDRDSSMVVWRYNLQNGMYEVGPFFNVDFKYVFPTADQVISVPAEQTFTYAVDYRGITVSYGDRTVFKPTPADLRTNFWTSARVTGWFGGSEVAPRTITYYQRSSTSLWG